jgi:glutamyl-tRNA reductase
MRLADLPQRLHEFDIIVSCTASSLPIIGLGMVDSAIKARRRRPVVMVDLAVPRDIEPEVGRLNDVYLYTVDDLSEIVQSGTDLRKAAVGQAEAIIETRVGHFMHWLESRGTVPLIQDIRQRGNDLKDFELERARKLLAKGEDPQAVIDALAQGLTNKFLHGSLHALQHAQGDDREALMKILPSLFRAHHSDK